MAPIDLARLTAPLSEAEPCGPDLEGDDAYENVVALVRGSLPARFIVRAEFGDERWPFAFDRAQIDLASLLAGIEKQLADTHDIRLLVPLAQLVVLNRDLEGFVTTIEAITTLLERHWSDVHPAGEGVGIAMRLAELSNLADPETVVFPLRYTPLAKGRRIGNVTYGSFMIADRQVSTLYGLEPLELVKVKAALSPDARDLDRAELVTARDRIVRLREVLARMENAVSQNGGHRLDIDKLKEVVNGIHIFLGEVLDEPVAATDGEDDGPVGAKAAPVIKPAGKVRSAADAARALASAAAYFRRAEPSSPAVLLIQQAQQLIGKNFFQVMQILIPSKSEKAKIKVGANPVFDLPLSQLNAVAEELGPPPDPIDGAGESAETGTADMVGSRNDAIALLVDVGAYYRSAEPSSPIPLITDRACALAAHNFADLLGDVLQAE